MGRGSGTGRSAGRAAPSTAWPPRPGSPRYAVRTVRPRLVRVPSTYSTWGPGGRPPCASGTYPTREAGTRSPYVPNGGAGACVSAQASTTSPGLVRHGSAANLVATWLGLGLGLGLGVGLGVGVGEGVGVGVGVGVGLGLNLVATSMPSAFGFWRANFPMSSSLRPRPYTCGGTSGCVAGAWRVRRGCVCGV